ncbi:uncharacterized protein PFC0810c-like [Odontomachus brunneus]|uniref:uncharacterized protein PFC0810c-like n=1 Tax=Odontomachus brunneus TaxID=486640 RepID=UPI0013F1AE6A|nr:uncharacterized protein PFC0810c-like [Odontomachus brunneus]
MRKFAHECGATHPERLRGTLLRKHIATNCHKLKLTEHEVSELANFMGHKENIHKQYYRLPQKENDILNISKYLEAALGTCDNSEDDTNSDDDDDTNTDNIELYSIIADDLSNSNTTNNNSNTTINNSNTTINNNITQESDSICAAKKRKTTTKNKNKLCNKDKVKTKYKHTRWTDEEKNIVLNKFSTYLNTYKYPLNKEITALIGDNSCLQTRTVRQVKTWLNNQQKILRNNI